MDRPATISAWKSSLAAGKWPGPTCDKKSLVRQNRQQRQFPLEHRSRGGRFIHHLQGRGPPALACHFEWHELGGQSCGRFLRSTEAIRFVMFS